MFSKVSTFKTPLFKPFTELCVFIGITGYTVEENRDSSPGTHVKRSMRRERRNIKEKERKGEENEREENEREENEREENEIFKIELFFLEEGALSSMCVYTHLQ